MSQPIPDQIKKFANSADLYNVVEKIGIKFSLHIDQMGELYAEISDVLLGFSKASEFTKHIIDRLEITRDNAEQIMQEVNKEVFQTLKNNLKQAQTEPLDLSALEHAGNFSIEQGNGGEENGGNDDKVEITPADRGKILSGIENPQPSREVREKKTGDAETYTEPLVDQLLQSAVAQPEQKVVKSAVPENLPIENMATPPNETLKKKGPDPYKEAI